MLETLNARFWAGQSAREVNDLERVGVLVRQHDKQSAYDHGEPWLPCPRGDWCSGIDQFWPASVINSHVRKLYYGDTRAGFVLSPSVKILCACQGDCNSISAGRGHRGCAPARCCDSAACGYRDHGCSYPPAAVGEALEAQLNRGVPSHNEIIVDNLHVRDHLPQAIAAFFYMAASTREVARGFHERFLSDFGLSDEQCPLLRLQLDGAGPFSPG